METSQFKDVVKSLLDNPVFADFTIKCAGGKEYKVHRAILASHSKYFWKCFELKLKEAEEGVIEIKKDNEEAVDLMIKFSYTFDYETKNETSYANFLELHAGVYATAEKYEVPDLKKLAVTKFRNDIVSSKKISPLPAIRLIYSSTPSSDRGFRDVILDLWQVASTPIIEQRGLDIVDRFMRDNPTFASDMALNYGKDRVSPRNCRCGRLIVP